MRGRTDCPACHSADPDVDGRRVCGEHPLPSGQAHPRTSGPHARTAGTPSDPAGQDAPGHDVDAHDPGVNTRRAPGPGVAYDGNTVGPDVPRGPHDGGNVQPEVGGSHGSQDVQRNERPAGPDDQPVRCDRAEPAQPARCDPEAAPRYAQVLEGMLAALGARRAALQEDWDTWRVVQARAMRANPNERDLRIYQDWLASGRGTRLDERIRDVERTVVQTGDKLLQVEVALRAGRVSEGDLEALVRDAAPRVVRHLDSATLLLALLERGVLTRDEVATFATRETAGG